MARRVKIKKGSKAKAKQKGFETLIQVLKGYDVKSVAEAAEVSDATLYNWMKGITTRPRLDTLERVSNALGMEVHIEIRHRKG